MKKMLHSICVWMKAMHSKHELKKAIHLIDKHQDALENALDSVGLRLHRNPKKKKAYETLKEMIL